MGCNDSKHSRVKAPSEDAPRPVQAAGVEKLNSPRTLLEDVGAECDKLSNKDSSTGYLASIGEGAQLNMLDPVRDLACGGNGEIDFAKSLTGSDSRSTDCSETVPSQHPVCGHAKPDNQTGAKASSGWLPSWRAVCGDQQLRKRKRTGVVQANETDFMVVQYSCRESFDDSSGTVVSQTSWTVVFGTDAVPIEILVRATETEDSRDVEVVCNEEVIFSERLDEYSSYEGQFQHAWFFQGRIREVHEPNIYEYRPDKVNAPQAWYPATLTCRAEDGKYELVALMSHSDGKLKEVCYTGVEKADIRRKGTNRPPTAPERYLGLEVPRCDPRQAVLNVDSSQLVTHYFARVSPPPLPDVDSTACCCWEVAALPPLPMIELRVDKEREIVKANVGHSVLKHFISGEVRATSSDKQRLRCRWDFQLGPFAEHVVELERGEDCSNVFKLIVDGSMLVEASASGLDCEDAWQCQFLLIGQRALNFVVFESDRKGTTLSTSGEVAQIAKYSHTCHIKIPNADDLAEAVLFIDEVDFAVLPPKSDPSAETPLSMDPQSLWAAYNILVPHKVAEGVVEQAEIEGADCGRPAFCCMLSGNRSQSPVHGPDGKAGAANAITKRKKICCAL